MVAFRVRVLVFVSFITLVSARSSKFIKERLATAVNRGYPLLMNPRSVVSEVQCAGLCGSSPFCSMYLHSAGTSQCALYGVTNNTTSTYVLDLGLDWRAFVYDSDCPYMYVKPLNACWRLVLDLQTQGHARTFCQSLGGDLIQVQSWSVFLFLKAALLSTPNWSTGLYWIGAAKSGGVFKWLDTSTAIDLQMWGTAQPDSFGSDYEDCVETMPYFGYAFNDVNCGQTRFSFCSVPFTFVYFWP